MLHILKQLTTFQPISQTMLGLSTLMGREVGTYSENMVQVTSYDSNGVELTYNESSKQDYTASWNSVTMRFRPHENATSLKIRIPLILSLHQPRVLCSLIPQCCELFGHMEWVNGSIVETAVSTGARSFNWGTTYGQSLVADILEDGVAESKDMCMSHT